MKRILIVEDDKELAQWIAEYLHTKGFVAETCHSGLEAIQHIEKTLPDLVLLDGMLPDIDGLDVCKQVREFYFEPIIMLTARDEEIDEVLGLEVGADDYLTKPVRANVLIARIRLSLRRRELTLNTQHNPTEHRQALEVSGLSIDALTRQVWLAGTHIELTSNEFDVIWVLAQRAGEVVSRESLINQLRGFDYDGFDRSIDLRISRIRKKLDAQQPAADRIKTIWGKGYMLVNSNR